ncbi:transketolase [Acholeplasma hippikon]|uniref:Transketolase n=1 Tax=Acholeplasma hippikon TaxID=264636 RepID=A0A449BKL0_9MOLU|nr:transketolase [Acholeplasma hippikon]VEU82988.1 Transketolase [Acholeplasma hippikon]
MNKDQLAINTIRFLGVDAINAANSGHPGIVIGAAPMAHTLFTKHLNIYPKNKSWINRDRFVLSAGHGSALLYALNHLSGYKISLADLKNFRNYPGITPGHPEYGHTEGVEATTGPLGQGISNAVGMAIAEAHLAAKFNQEGFNIIDHYTYVLCGDGDLQEGVALEAISLAGHLGLGKLIVLYDSNDIQLDGKTSLAISDDVKKKFEAQGWQYIKVNDGEDIAKVNQAIIKAKKELNKPTIIEVKTIIGRGTSNEGTSKVHGSPIGEAEASKLREKLGYTYAPFEVAKEVYSLYKSKVFNRGKKAFNEWEKMFASYEVAFPALAKEFKQYLSGEFNLDFSSLVFAEGSKDATRNMLGKALDLASKLNGNIIGGSADLTSSTKAKGADGNFLKDSYIGRNINFGVREHAMGAVVNGINLHGGLRSFSGAFFVFSDYMKPTLRLAAMMHLPSLFIFSHDSVAVGEDGPTHEPIEQLVGLRSIPNLGVIRPADGTETISALEIALSRKNKPTAIITSRQNVRNLATTSKEGVAKGAYIVDKENVKLDGILLAAGSEVELAIETKAILKEKGYDIRVVSMPSHDEFLDQDKAYQMSILPKGVKTLAIEMGSSYSWYRFTEHVMGIDTYGLSAAQNKVVEHFGFVPEIVAEKFVGIME